MKIKIRKRNSKCIFNNSCDIVELYKELILYCENDEDIKFIYDRRLKPYRNLKEKYGLLFEINLKSLQYKDVKTNVFYFNSNNSINNWFKSLRDAFAHNRIFVSNDNTVIIQNVNNKKLKMHARMESLEILKEIIRDIKGIQIKIKTK